MRNHLGGNCHGKSGAKSVSRAGWVRLGEELCTINVLPPATEWQGDLILEGYEPAANRWIIYADGEEFLRFLAPELPLRGPLSLPFVCPKDRGAIKGVVITDS